MKLITEITEDIKYLSEDKNGQKNLYIEGIFLQGAIKNRNGRIYPVNVLANEVQRYNEQYVLKNRAFGELGHPNGPSINLDRVSHMITSLRQEGTNFIGRAAITNTPMGNIVRGLMESGAQLGVSSRGMGSIKEVNGINEVQSDFFLATAADIVADPSAPDAFVNGIMEGVEFLYSPDGSLIRKELAAEQAKDQINTLVRKREFNEQAALRVFDNYLKSLV